MNYSINERYNCIVIEFSGDLMGGPDANRFNEDLHDLIDQGKKEVVADLSNVKFMNSSGLGILIGGLTTMRNAGGDLRIAGADQRIESLLMVTKLITVFNSYRTVEEAVNSYEEEPVEKGEEE
ncbi:MAG: anti-sigma factor antagonist [Nitrosopumilaceae archaeon]|nr:STAS domain-containing protein [Nitrosopumilaceae archaeon]NIU88530.1 anti-sigma factor antagonist [Nitrosopumilaceae archaeon]NIX63163.1 anti-sigma factor antagonist [Nitrosopumilaceae archaeon]